MADRESQLPILKIDNEGRFKYIQIKMTKKSDPSDTKILVRGSGKFKFHNENFENFMTEEVKATPDDLYTYEPIGGGRIEFMEGNKISVYGVSTAYGQCSHEKTVEIIKKYFPNAEKYEINWSNIGY